MIIDNYKKYFFSATRTNSFGNLILSVHVRSNLTFIVAPAATGGQAARWSGSWRGCVSRRRTIIQVPSQPRPFPAAKPDLACRSGLAFFYRMEAQTRLRSAQMHPPPCPRAVCSCRSHSSREWTCAGTHGAQGGGCRLGQGFWAGLGQVQRPFVQVQRSLQLVGA